MESKATDFKRKYKESIKYTAVAFANISGGKFTSVLMPVSVQTLYGEWSSSR